MTNSLVVIGTGLIGGSFALAARQAGLFAQIIGVEPDAERAAAAVSLGVVDKIHSDLFNEIHAINQRQGLGSFH